jgi:uncharacterized protein
MTSSPSSSRIVLAGGSGFIGGALARRFRRDGHDVVVLTRTARARTDAVREVMWDGRTAGPWARELDGAAAVVNLTGKSLNCRHTSQNRRDILASRLDSVRAVADAVSAAASPPPVWVQASAVGIYGNAGDRICDEGAPHGNDFVAQVCEQWEEALRDALLTNTRRVVLRLGVALGRRGGALVTLARLAKWGMGGRIGNGRQYISWIHIVDLAAAVDWVISHPAMSGPYNIVSHTPTTNATFMRELRHAVHRPWSPPVPAPAVRLGAFIIGTEGSLALEGQRCAPRRLDESGFHFTHENLDEALATLLHLG